MPDPKKKATAPKKAAATKKAAAPAGGKPANRQGKPENLTPWAPGVSGNPHGRPLKIYTQLKKTGYGKDDITTAFREMAFYNLEELKALVEKKTTPVLLQIVAVSLKKAIEKGDLGHIRDLLEYVLGSPQRRIEHSGPEGGPIPLQATNIDYGKLSTQALLEIAAAEIKPQPHG